MQIEWILEKFILPDIRPDIRIVTKINRDLFWHRNMNSWKFHAANYYHFWDIVWANIREKKIRITGRISGQMIESDWNFHQFFKSTLYIHPGSFMQIRWILRKFIPPDIRLDIWIVTKINRDLFWHRNMNSWKSYVVSYYHFWVIVWTNIHTKISNPDIRPDVRPDNRIEFKLSSVL